MFDEILSKSWGFTELYKSQSGSGNSVTRHLIGIGCSQPISAEVPKLFYDLPSR